MILTFCLLFITQSFPRGKGAETCGEEAASAAADLDVKLALANVTVEALCQDIYDDAKTKTKTVSILIRQELHI